MRCSFRKRFDWKIRGKKLSIRNKKAVINMTRKLCHKRDAAIPDAELEHRVVRKLAQEGFLAKYYRLPSRRIKML